MSEENVSDSYEVGYGKPPKDTQFKKGVSGNPKGRPRKILDFHQELLRQSRDTIIIIENGKPRRISKHEAVIKQLINKAIGGNIPATRSYLGHHLTASEQEALREAVKASNAARYNDLDNLTDEELMRIATGGLKDKE
jgi:Family of unknown function (DUF5681)